MLSLYAESCEATKLREVRIQKLETTLNDQAKIAEAKTQYYENKLKEVTRNAEVDLAAAQVEHEGAMASFREEIKNSAIISLLQARIKMAYEARATGLECPAWPVESWVAKLKELGGSPVPCIAGSEAGESSKAAEAVAEIGEGTDAGANAGEDARAEAAKKVDEDAAV